MAESRIIATPKGSCHDPLDVREVPIEERLENQPELVVSAVVEVHGGHDPASVLIVWIGGDPRAEVVCELVNSRLAIRVDPEGIIRRKCIKLIQAKANIHADAVGEDGVNRRIPGAVRPADGSLQVAFQPFVRNHHFVNWRGG
jgi:hypothetical protein